MRHLDSKPYHVIIPFHVGRLLAQVERTTAAAIRNELESLAQRLGEQPPSFSEPRMRKLSMKGFTLEYECDPQNEALIAMDLIGNLGNL